MLLILKIIKIFKKVLSSIVVMWQHMFSMPVMRTVWSSMDDNTFLNILIIFIISNIDKEVNKELPEDDLIEDRNILECFLKCFK